MTPKRFHILFFLLTALLSASPSQAQETLKASRIEAKGARRYLPSLGLPRRADGGIDRLIRYDIPIWTGREDVKATPNWNMCELRPGSMIPAGVPGEVAEICLQWLSESPKGRLSIVFGPLWRGTYVALCRKSTKSLGWKSICFLIPEGGVVKGISIYRYSMSVNRLEHMTGYDFFPGLPSHLQEIEPSLREGVIAVHPLAGACGVAHLVVDRGDLVHDRLRVDIRFDRRYLHVPKEEWAGAVIQAIDAEDF